MTFQEAGAGLGSMFGPIGGIAGTAVGGILDHLSGRGSYKLKKNTIAFGGTGPPTFSHEGDGVVLVHREFLANVTSPGSSFALTAYPINPGIFGSFPYLSTVANSFEEYIMEGLVYEFKTTSATAVSSTNTALGVVIAATNYDPLDPLFQSKVQMEAYEFANSAVPCQSFLHPVECARNQTPLDTHFLRSGAIPTGADIRMYDLGTFQIATSGQQATSVVGELWVTYHVRLLKPKLPNPFGDSILVGRALSNSLATLGVPQWSPDQPGSTMVSLSTTPATVSYNTSGRFIVTSRLWASSGGTIVSGGQFLFYGAVSAADVYYVPVGGAGFAAIATIDTSGLWSYSIAPTTLSSGTIQWVVNVNQTTATNVALVRAPTRYGPLSAPLRIQPTEEKSFQSSGVNDDSGWAHIGRETRVSDNPGPAKVIDDWSSSDPRGKWPKDT